MLTKAAGSTARSRANLIQTGPQASVRQSKLQILDSRSAQDPAKSQYTPERKLGLGSNKLDNGFSFNCVYRSYWEICT